MSNVTNNADLGFTCAECGLTASGKAIYANELIQAYNRHEPCFRVDIKVRGMIEPKRFGENTATSPSGEGENTSE